MTTIIRKSDNGFQTNDFKWLTCDKFKVLDKSLFKNLKVGDEIDSIKMNNKGYVISFNVLSKDQEEVESSPPSPAYDTVGCNTDGGKVLNPQQFNSKPPSVQDSIRYAQCVNIAFSKIDYMQYHYNKESEFITDAFNLADKIYLEFQKRCSR